MGPAKPYPTFWLVGKQFCRKTTYFLVRNAWGHGALYKTRCTFGKKTNPPFVFVLAFHSPAPGGWTPPTVQGKELWFRGAEMRGDCYYSWPRGPGLLPLPANIPRNRESFSSSLLFLYGFSVVLVNVESTGFDPCAPFWWRPLEACCRWTGNRVEDEWRLRAKLKSTVRPAFEIFLDGQEPSGSTNLSNCRSPDENIIYQLDLARIYHGPASLGIARIGPGRWPFPSNAGQSLRLSVALPSNELAQSSKVTFGDRWAFFFIKNSNSRKNSTGHKVKHAERWFHLHFTVRGIVDNDDQLMIIRLRWEHYCWLRRADLSAPTTIFPKASEPRACNESAGYNLWDLPPYPPIRHHHTAGPQHPSPMIFFFFFQLLFVFALFGRPHWPPVVSRSRRLADWGPSGIETLPGTSEVVGLGACRSVVFLETSSVDVFPKKRENLPRAPVNNYLIGRSFSLREPRWREPDFWLCFVRFATNGRWV